MGKIDDPLDQTEFQHRDEGVARGLTILLNFAAPVVSLLSQEFGALATLGAFATQFTAQHRLDSRARALQEGLREAYGDLESRQESIEKKVVGPEAEEAITVAVRNALNSARLDKAHRFGRIIGATLAEDAPNWREAAEFIRTLEEFSDSDLEALRILWNNQRSAYRVITNDRREMSTDANDFTGKWKDILEQASKQSITKDDWYSRCARLSGFGLTALVQSNAAHQGPDAMCYRLTGRAVRLLKLLGKNIDPGAYPAWRYHPTKPEQIVNDEEEDLALGEGWSDRPLPKTQS
jgi:hypothetical protein